MRARVADERSSGRVIWKHSLVPPDSDVQPRRVMVRERNEDEEWTLVPIREDRQWSIELTGPDRSWTGSGCDCFNALRDLRTKLDADGLLVGLNGARPECTVSGMLADMGEGRSVYVLVHGAKGRPATLKTLDPAPLDAVGTVQAQDAFKERWLSERSKDRD